MTIMAKWRKLIASWRWRWDMFRLVRRAAALPIKAAGVDNDGDPYITLEDGLTLLGHRTAVNIRRFYRFVPIAKRSTLPVECLRVAIDYIVRYQGGALRRGGPVKQAFYRVQWGDTVVEMGGYIGIYALRLAREVGLKGRVIVIEPNPDNVRLLQKNININGFEHVSVIPKGVWHEPGVMPFSILGDDMQSGSLHLKSQQRRTIQVPVDTLDNLLTGVGVQHVDFMVIQLNGVEINALQGLTVLKPRHLAIAARYDLEDGRNAAEAIEALLSQRGYRVRTLERAFVYADLE